MASKVIFGTMAKLAEAGVFVYLGVVAALSLGRFHWHIGCTAFALVAIVVARAAHAARQYLEPLRRLFFKKKTMENAGKGLIFHPN